MFVLSFNVIPYFQSEKNFFLYLITTTSRRHTISLVYHHRKIIAMKLLKVKLNAKIGRKITQRNYGLYRPLFDKFELWRKEREIDEGANFLTYVI